MIYMHICIIDPFLAMSTYAAWFIPSFFSKISYETINTKLNACKT
jgi:hypothetical protein